MCMPMDVTSWCMHWASQHIVHGPKMKLPEFTATTSGISFFKKTGERGVRKV